MSVTSTRTRLYLMGIAQLLLLQLWAFTGSVVAAPAPAYDMLLERVKSGDTTIDFRELRFAYAETPQYSPYGSSKSDAKNALLAAYDAQQDDKVTEYLESVLKSNYVDIEAHIIASMKFAKDGNQEKSNFHRSVAKGLIDSILNSGDGKGPDTAFWVISVDEEYAILRVFRLKVKSQSVSTRDGHYYDVLQVTDPKTSEPLLPMYFCIDKPYIWLQNSMKK